MNICDIYKIGMGPSSSHTMGPLKAAERFAAKIGVGSKVVVELLGSLASTGKGHLTDKAIREGLAGFETEIIWSADKSLSLHPNGMIFSAFDESGNKTLESQICSIGGGEICDASAKQIDALKNESICNSLDEILDECVKSDRTFWQFVQEHDTAETWDYLSEVWQTMRDAIELGLTSKEETLVGSLGLARRAKNMKKTADRRVGFVRDLNLVSSYALAVAEQNASGGIIVTAPTCGSAGVLPAVLYYFQHHLSARKSDIIKALATAGLFAKVVATRASVSGAEVGCQGEVGTACAMASAAVTQLQGGNIRQIEYAAEMGLEHCLGLTCDPIEGLVQVPCIERNAMAAMRAMECAAYALATDGRHLVSFDDVTDVMYATGKDLQSKYRETAAGGLAKIRRRKIKH